MAHGFTKHHMVGQLLGCKTLNPKPQTQNFTCEDDPPRDNLNPNVKVGKGCGVHACIIHHLLPKQPPILSLWTDPS